MTTSNSGPVTPEEAEARVSLAPAPPWAVRDLWASPLDAVDGVGVCLSSWQMWADPADVALYRRTVMEVREPGGVAKAAAWTFEFDPTQERFELHSLELVRDGVVRDLLPTARREVMRREPNAERAMFDGAYTLLVTLDDIRVGDVIDCALSWRGRSPVYGPWAFAYMPIAKPRPVGRMTARIWWPADRRAQVRVHGLDLEPRVTAGADTVLYEIDRMPAPSWRPDPGAPSWWADEPVLGITEYADWSEVADWAAPLFAHCKPTPAVLELAQVLAEGTAPDARLLRAERAVRFVQDEVRYLYSGYGPASVTPADPDLVLARRAGDCKGKSALLVALLEAFGVPAVPALTSLRAGPRLPEELPSPVAFDHVIVRAEFGGEVAWIDPTVAGERRDLREPDPGLRGYAIALPRDPDMPTRLEALPEIGDDPPLGRLVREHITVGPNPEAAVAFDCTTELFGLEADIGRRRLARDGLDGIKGRLIRASRRRHPGADYVEPIEVRYDPDANTLRGDARVIAVDAWEPIPGGGWMLIHPIHEVKPIAHDVGVPRDRLAPLEIFHPFHRRQEVVITLPPAEAPWRPTLGEEVIENDAFCFRRIDRLVGNELTVTIEITTKTPSVPATTARAVLADMRRMLGLGAVILRWPEAPPPPAPPEGPSRLVDRVG